MILINNKVFTLIELIIVIVIMAIILGIGFNKPDEYITSSKLSKMEQEFFTQKNAAQVKFSKSFVDETGVSWSVDSSSTLSGYLDTGFGILGVPLRPSLSNTKGIIINGQKIAIFEKKINVR